MPDMGKFSLCKSIGKKCISVYRFFEGRAPLASSATN